MALGGSSKSGLKKISFEDISSLPSNYDPIEDSGEYMNDKRRMYFYNVLVKMRADLSVENERLTSSINDLREHNLSDEIDVASNYDQVSYNMRKRERNINLIKRIDDCITRINTGDYGYCKETNEEIGIERLIANPIASLSIVAQEEYENREKIQKIGELDEEAD